MSENRDRATELLWRLYQEHCAQGRHQDAQRSGMTAVVTAIASGIVGVITYDKEVNHSDWPLAALLIALGAFGVLFALKLHEKFTKNVRRASAYLSALDELVPEGKFLTTMQRGDATRPKWYRALDLLKMYFFASLLQGFIVLIGLFLLYNALTA
jgi:hypothetical protein